MIVQKKKLILIILYISAIIFLVNCRSTDCSRDDVELPDGNLGNQINSSYDDFGAVITENGKMIFTSNKQGLEGYIDEYSKYGEDLFWTHSVGGSWAKADIFRNFEPNTTKNEGAPSIAGDLSVCYFARSYDERGPGGSDIYKGLFDESTTKIYNIELVKNVNSKFWDSQPAITTDGKMMIFVSDRPGGFGGTDLWISLQKDGEWTTAKNLGAKFNTGGDEYSPSFLCEKDTILFYASNGRDDGLGELDIYCAFRNCEKSRLLPEGWYEVSLVGGNVNTRSNDAFPFATASTGKIYFASDREGGCGGNDLYSDRLEFSPPCLPLKGTIIDKASGNKVQYPITITFKERSTGKSIDTETRNGSYLFESFCRGNYTISISADRYTNINYNYNVSACETELIHELESECLAVSGVAIDSSKSAVLGKQINILVPTAIEFYNKQSGDKISVSTNPPESNYSIDKLCPGDYRITIRPNNEERRFRDTYLGYWDKVYDMSIDVSNTNLVHEIVPWEYEFVNDSIPFFVTGYYIPNVPKSLEEVREKRRTGKILAKADYIGENEENAEYYSTIVKRKFDTFVNHLNSTIFPVFIKSANENTLIEIKIEGYTDPRRITPNYYYENTITHKNINIATNESETVQIEKRKRMNNETLSVLRAYYTMEYLEELMSDLPLYNQLKEKGRINYIIDGKGIAPDASKDRPQEFPANRHVRIFVSQRRSK